mgnify:CR=1 FL=1
MGVLPAYKESFFCSPDRADGLQLTMLYEDGLVSCEMNINNRFEGYTDVVHGGMLFGVLDVMIWYAIFMATKKICMTRKTEMEYFKPVLCNHPYVAKVRFLAVEERDFLSEGWIEDRHGQICARVNALFREGKDISVEKFVKKFDFSYAAPEIRDYFLSLLDEERKEA